MRINVSDLSKLYDKKIAVNKLSVEIEKGKLVSVLGPSGCGKSTLLYMLAGIIEPTEGEILFNQEKVNEVPTEKRNIGLVFQNYSLYPHLTVMENLIFPLRMKGINKKSALEEAKNMSKLLRIEELLERKPKQLSGGQQQRVAIGRALIKKPDLLLMDEPFSNLDAALRLEMREEIRTLQKKFNITTLFVTHDQEEAMAISDKILLMNNGQAVQYCPAEELYNNPNSLYSASFIGNPKINIIKEDNEINMLLKYIDNRKFNAIGIRPEHIKIMPRDEKEDFIRGNIMDIIQIGKETHCKLVINGLTLRAVSLDKVCFHQGEEVKVGFKKIHYFMEE